MSSSWVKFVHQHCELIICIGSHALQLTQFLTYLFSCHLLICFQVHGIFVQLHSYDNHFLFSSTLSPSLSLASLSIDPEVNLAWGGVESIQGCKLQRFANWWSEQDSASRHHQRQTPIDADWRSHCMNKAVKLWIRNYRSCTEDPKPKTLNSKLRCKPEFRNTRYNCGDVRISICKKTECQLSR